jgi:hypothetical protein
MCRRQLKDGHQREEGRNDAQDKGTCPQVLRKQDDRGAPDDLEAEGIVKVEPVKVEDSLRIGNGKEAKQTCIVGVGRLRRSLGGFHKSSEIGMHLTEAGKEGIRSPIVDISNLTPAFKDPPLKSGS